ncbi:hypothetical protein, partial [Pseudomonas aeruginosa]
GDSDPTNFTRAFKLFTAEPPMDSRARLLGGHTV